MRIHMFLVAVFLSLSVAVAEAADTEPAAASSNELSAARTALDKEDYKTAEDLLRVAVNADPGSADAWNLLGYATRKQGMMDEAEGHYGKALAIDDEHTGALEYLGMLYVQTGRIEDAKKLLARLDSACLFGCDEYDNLKKAITTLKAY